MKAPSINAMSLSSMMKNEMLMHKALVAVSAIILAGVLIGLSQYGIDLSSVFLGTHWNSPLAETRGTMALEGAIASITLVFGGLFIMGIMVLLKGIRKTKGTE